MIMNFSLELYYLIMLNVGMLAYWHSRKLETNNGCFLKSVHLGAPQGPQEVLNLYSNPHLMSGATAGPIGQIHGFYGVCQYNGVKSHVKWENFIISRILSNFLRYIFQFLKLQFSTKILALSIKKNREALSQAVLRDIF